MTLAFVDSPLDRAHLIRTDDNALSAHRGDAASRLVRVNGDAVLFDQGELHLDHGGIPDNSIFLGLDAEQIAWFATSVAASESLVPIRSLMVEASLPDATLSILAQARSLSGWHDRHGFCASCGRPTHCLDAGYRRHCTACGTDHFPRTDPVVIMAVRYEQKFLLGRQTAWPPKMYSALAGFMEPGETIEQAVRREVLEETAVRVGKVTYVASQPWPFPSSLMIGMIAEAETDAITIDPKELESARWFDASEVKQMLQGNHPDGLWASRPQAIAHVVVSEALRSLALG